MKKVSKLGKLEFVEYSTSSITIGQYFREERLRAKITEMDAAKSLGVTTDILLDYESGRVQIPFDVIYDVAQLYSSAIEDVLDLLLKVSFHDAAALASAPTSGKKIQKG